jgi:hypothetical protein
MVMKKIIFCVIFLFVSCAQSQAQMVEDKTSGIRENVDYSEINNVYLRISKTPENVDGYVVFLDENGEFCSVEGTITLSVKKKKIIGKSNAKPKPIEVVEEVLAYSEQIAFKPEDFKFLALPLGGMVYALPVSLPLDKVAERDIVLLEWRTFKSEQKVAEF